MQLLQPGIESTGASLIASMAKGRPCLEDMNTREKQVIGSSSNTPKQGVVDSVSNCLCGRQQIRRQIHLPSNAL